MRVLLRIVAAHVLASWILQLVLIVWVLLAGQHFNPLKAAIAMVFAPILIPVALLRIGPRVAGVGYAVYWVLYVAAFVGSYLLLRWRRSL